VRRTGLLFGLLLLSFLVRAEELSGAGLVAELRKGGYVLYMRHTSTDFSTDDSKSSSFEDCANQRPLTDKGRSEARTVARHLERLGILVDKVYASPMCRTVETAMLAFGKAEKTPAARGGPVRSDDPKRYDGLRKLLATPPAPGTNNAIASHGNPFHAVFGPPYLAEGEIAVVRPGGKTGYEIAGRIRLGDWENLR
jgi:histidine phosphatase superfamily protein (branch 1)